MERLTKKAIDQAETDKVQDILWDGAQPGFGLRVTKNGTKSFIIQYRNKYGRSRRYTVGRYGPLTLDQARRRAQQLLSEVHQGRDPMQEAQTSRACISVADLADRYMRDHCEGRCKASTMEAHRWLLAKLILPELGAYAINELRQEDIAALHQSLKATPYNANRVLGLLKAMLGRAEVWGLMPQGQNPAKGIRKFREEKRQRFLSVEELGRLLDTLSRMEATGEIAAGPAAAYRLLVLTGARLGEVRTLKWSDIDWDRRHILLNEHKSNANGAKVIPLNEAAVAVLKGLPRMEGSLYVFPGADPERPLVNLQKPWRKIRARAGLEDVRIHDLRHSFASFGIGAGLSLPIVGGLLGHRSQQATATYAHLATDPLRQASDAIGRLIAERMGGNGG